MKKNVLFNLEAVIKSYAILFFSQNKTFGLLLMAVSFFTPAAGLAGLLSVLLALGLVNLMKYDKESIRTGFYSFNALLLGIGLGTFYRFNISFFTWLFVGCMLVTVLSGAIAYFLGKSALPLLSLPFVLTFWLLLSASVSIYHMGLEQRNSAILNEMYSAGNGGARLTIGAVFISVPGYFALFFRCLSAVLFQNNMLSGLLLSIGLLIHSRIGFSLMVLTFAAACCLNHLTGTYPEGISYYHLGSNIMMASAAIGSFFLIPSLRSYIWAIIAIPITFLLINSFTRLFGFFYLPVLSLPFCVTTLLLLCLFKLRSYAGKLVLTPLQHYSPERNLYQYLNVTLRQELKYLKLSLPFMGTWTVSQGYNGNITHKGDWAQALDFVVTDEDGVTYNYPGTQPQHYYSFNKPVLACADGIIEEVVNHVEDNEIGQVNLAENWGNSVVIKHLPGLYSKVSHLKRGSLKVKPGDFVKQGDVLALCGNSGRSPEPHLHFQVQSAPHIGSKTLSYPFAWYINAANRVEKLQHFKIPVEGTAISPVEINSSLKKAFKFAPGYTAILSAEGKPSECLEVFTDAFNQSYFYSQTTAAAAYFTGNGAAFYFNSFYGDKSSLLYYFYLAAYKVVFTTTAGIAVEDFFPLQVAGAGAIMCLHDLVAPFHQFIKLKYQSVNTLNGALTVINASQHSEIFGKDKQVMAAQIQLEGGDIDGFSIDINKTKTTVKWMAKNTWPA